MRLTVLWLWFGKRRERLLGRFSRSWKGNVFGRFVSICLFWCACLLICFCFVVCSILVWWICFFIYLFFFFRFFVVFWKCFVFRCRFILEIFFCSVCGLWRVDLIFQMYWKGWLDGLKTWLSGKTDWILLYCLFSNGYGQRRLQKVGIDVSVDLVRCMWWFWWQFWRWKFFGWSFLFVGWFRLFIWKGGWVEWRRNFCKFERPWMRELGVLVDGKFVIFLWIFVPYFFAFSVRFCFLKIEVFVKFCQVFLLFDFLFEKLKMEMIMVYEKREVMFAFNDWMNCFFMQVLWVSFHFFSRKEYFYLRFCYSHSGLKLEILCEQNFIFFNVCGV